MEAKREKTVKQIANQYRFLDIEDFEKHEIVKMFKDLYYESLETKEELNVTKERLRIAEAERNEMKNYFESKPKYSEYDPDWTGIDKIIYILKENQRAMSSKEIELALLEVDPSYQFAWRNSRIASATYISRGIRFNRLIKHKLEGTGYVYGLPEWFENNCVHKK